MVSGGGIAGNAQAVVSSDGKALFLPNGNITNVHDAQSGRRTARLKGHSDIVTGVALHPFNTYQVYSVSRDGTIRLWDFSDGREAKQLDVGKPILALVAPHRQENLYLQLETESKDFGSTTKKLNFSTWKLGPEELKTKNFSALAASSDGELVGVAQSRSLIVWSAKSGWTTSLKLHHTKEFKCLALENTQGRVAGGDVSGRILIWHNLKAGFANVLENKEHEMSCTTVHWHSHPVQSLSFSLDSAYLLSGGSEAVLIAWQLGTNSKRLLPRLSSSILGIVPYKNDAALYLVTQKDNTVRTVNLASMKVELSISGLKPGPKKLPDQIFSQPAVSLLPGGGELVIAAENDVIQFYDAVNDRHLHKLQVKPINVVSPVEDNIGSSNDWSDIEPQVTHIAFSEDGLHMATIDVKADASTSQSYSTSLKFWDRRASNAQASTSSLFEVQSQIDEPHSKRCTGIAFHPSEDLLASISMDGNLHLWNVTKTGKLQHWQCFASLSYLGLPMSCLAFSADGSIIAVGCGPSMILWSSKTGNLIDVLKCNLGSPKFVQHLTFVPGTPFLVGALHGQQDYLVVWNLLIKAVWWSCQISVTALTADGLGTGNIGVGIKPIGGLQKRDASGFVSLFNVASPKPIQVWVVPLSWASALFFPPPSSQLFAKGSNLAPEGSNPLLVLTNERQFTIAAGPGVQVLEPTIEDIEMKDVQETDGFFTLSNHIKGPINERPQPLDIMRQQNLDTKAKVEMLFDAPTHALPSIDTLAPAFLEMLVCGISEPGPSSQ